MPSFNRYPSLEELKGMLWSLPSILCIETCAGGPSSCRYLLSGRRASQIFITFKFRRFVNTVFL